MDTLNPAWEFCTDQFRICLFVEPEDLDPADSFQFEEDIAAVRDGTVEWFQASVVVYWKGRKIGADHLGACAYSTVRKFFTAHWDSPYDGRNTLELKARNASICHYFPDMVRQAVAEARRALCNVPKMRCA